MSYHHLTTYERGRIEALHRLGYSDRKIALSLGRHRSCIDREIKRNTAAIAVSAVANLSAESIQAADSISLGVAQLILQTLGNAL